MIYDKPRLSMSEVARQMEVHTSTAFRWYLNGVRGVKLRTVSIGGKRFVLEEDLHAFLDDLNPDRSIQRDNIEQRADAAGKVLDAKGVRVLKEGE